MGYKKFILPKINVDVDGTELTIAIQKRANTRISGDASITEVIDVKALEDAVELLKESLYMHRKEYQHCTHADKIETFIKSLESEG